jgi:hypothetical protein
VLIASIVFHICSVDLNFDDVFIVCTRHNLL